MKEKFTPGNWVALDGEKPWDKNEKVINICQEEGAQYTQYSSDVCELMISHDNPAVVRANASLIAASPKMYRMIKTLIGNYQVAASIAENEGYETRYMQDAELVKLLLAEVNG